MSHRRHRGWDPPNVSGRRGRRMAWGIETRASSVHNTGVVCMTASFSLYGGGIPRQRGAGKEYTTHTSHPICAWSQPLCYLSHASAQRLLASCTSRSSARSSLQQRAKPVPTGSVFSYGFFFKKLQRIRGAARPSPSATEDDRRRAAVAGMARPTRPVAWCHPGCRCNQRRTLLVRTGTPFVL